MGRRLTQRYGVPLPDPVPSSVAELAGPFWEYMSESQGSEIETETSRQLEWALLFTMEVVDRGRLDEATALLVALAEAASDSELEILGAGQLESFLHRTDGVIEPLAHRLARSPRLRRALSYVWESDEMTPRVRAWLRSEQARPAP